MALKQLEFDEHKTNLNDSPNSFAMISKNPAPGKQEILIWITRKKELEPDHKNVSDRLLKTDESVCNITDLKMVRLSLRRKLSDKDGRDRLLSGSGQ